MLGIKRRLITAASLQLLGAVSKAVYTFRLLSTPLPRPPLAAGQVWGSVKPLYGGSELRRLWVVDVSDEAGVMGVVYRDDRPPVVGQWEKNKRLPLDEIERELKRLKWSLLGNWLAESLPLPEQTLVAVPAHDPKPKRKRKKLKRASDER
jgi:hypothetical protein